MSLAKDLTSIITKDDILKPMIAYIKKIFPNQISVLDRQNVPRPNPPYFLVNVLTPLTRLSFSDNQVKSAIGKATC